MGATGCSFGFPGQAEVERVKVLLADERKIAYNFAKKFFEYANGYKPDLKQRLHLWEFLGRGAENGGLQTLVTEVLEYSLSDATK